MIELHCHTTCSDGTLSPTQLVETAAQVGVQALAITDHDTIAGWPEARAAAQQHGIEIVPGIELSTVHHGRSLHILGYYPNPEQLLAPLQERVEGRQRRAQAMVEKLAELGYPIQIPTFASGVAPGRPHIAAALYRAGHVNSMQDAFQRLIGEGKPAYVAYEKFSITEGIALLKSSGAVPVWAHPFLFRGADIEKTLQDLLAAGLMGIEVYHPEHTPRQIQQLEDWCTQHQLLMTGGTDYHGPNLDSKRAATHPLNSFQLPLSLLEPIQQAATDLKQRNS